MLRFGQVPQLDRPLLSPDLSPEGVGSDAGISCDRHGELGPSARSGAFSSRLSLAPSARDFKKEIKKLVGRTLSERIASVGLGGWISRKGPHGRYHWLLPQDGGGYRTNC